MYVTVPSPAELKGTDSVKLNKNCPDAVLMAAIELTEKRLLASVPIADRQYQDETQSSEFPVLAANDSLAGASSWYFMPGESMDKFLQSRFLAVGSAALPSRDAPTVHNESVGHVSSFHTRTPSCLNRWKNRQGRKTQPIHSRFPIFLADNLEQSRGIGRWLAMLPN